MAEELKQIVFGFGSKFIQDGLNSRVHTAGASRVFRRVCNCDGPIDLCERNIVS